MYDVLCIIKYNGGITGQNERNEKGKDVTIWYTR